MPLAITHFVISVASADPTCSMPMVPREIFPADQSAGVPINSEVLVALVGDGSYGHIDLSLRPLSGGEAVLGDTEGVCYEHEADTEMYCNLVLRPYKDLAENTAYLVTIRGTTQHGADTFNYVSTFVTGSEPWTISTDAPVVRITGYVPRPEGALDPCDWQTAMKYELMAESLKSENGYDLPFHVYEVDPDTCDEQIVHTLFPQNGQTSFGFRQVIRPGTEGPRCYRIEQQDWAGNRTDSSETKCWNPDEEQEETFAGCPKMDDSGAPLDAEAEPDVPQDADSETSQSEGDGPSAKVTVDSTANRGCTGSQGALLLPLLLCRRRRTQDP